MLFTNAWIFCGEEGFQKGSFRVAEGRFWDFHWEEGADACLAEEMVDLGGLYVIPGLVDIHAHGCCGADFSDGDAGGLERMGRYLAAHGITSFLPTSMTLPYDRLEAAFRTAEGYMENRPSVAARILGVHMEGPYFSEKKKGAQNAAYLRLPDAAGFLHLQEKCNSLVKIVDVAPELPGAEDFIRQVSKI